MTTSFKPGDRVRISTAHLRSTGQFTGPEAPTNVGPFARGKVVSGRPFADGVLVMVEWEDGVRRNIHGANLEKIAI